MSGDNSLLDRVEVLDSVDLDDGERVSLVIENSDGETIEIIGYDRPGEYGLLRLPTAPRNEVIKMARQRRGDPVPLEDTPDHRP